MALSRKLYYDNTGVGGWVDISNYVIQISPIEYKIDNRVQGQSAVLKVTLDTNANYGTNQYKLEIGSNYILLSPPLDGIEELGNERVAVSLVDYFFNQLKNKAPLKLSGYTDAAAIAGGEVNIKSLKDFISEYTTSQHKLSIDAFTSRDDLHYSDGMGNIIEFDNNVRYSSRGAIKAESRQEDLGLQFVKMDDILTQLITGEGLTADFDLDDVFGTESKVEDTDNLPANIKKVWDVKLVKYNGNYYFIILYSKVNLLVCGIYNDSWILQAESAIMSQDWDEDDDGAQDVIGYQLYIDYYQPAVYFVYWKASPYTWDANNQYLLNVNKFDFVSDSWVYSIEYTAVDLFGWVVNRQNITNKGRNREERWKDFGRFNMMACYCNSSVFRLLIGVHGSASLYVLDPDKKYASQPNDSYEYTADQGLYHLVMDRINGQAVCFSYDTNFYKEYFRVDQSTLTAPYAMHGQGGQVVEEDNPYTSDAYSTPKTMWREAIIYDDPPSGSVEYFYRPPQIPCGVYTRNGFFNKYLRDTENKIAMSISDVDYAGSSWNPNNDILFLWKTNVNEDPTTITWKYKLNSVYRYLWLYQCDAYIDRLQQFMDAVVSFGYFYEQRDGDVRLVRIDGSGASLGTFVNVLMENKIEGFTRFADEYSIRILDRKLTYESGTKKRTIRKIMGEYGWIGTDQQDILTDWAERVNSGNNGIILDIDMGQFYDVASTYIPNLGKKFTYDSVVYNLIGAKIDIENWIIKITGVKDVT